MRGIIAVHLLCLILLTTGSLIAAPAPGSLVVNTDNPRYFMVKDDPAREAIYLTGSHIWNNLQDYGLLDPPTDHLLDFTGHLDWLQNEQGHNFTRGWAWEQPKWMPWVNETIYFDPVPYYRNVQGKFDLNTFNQGYFDRLLARATEAGNRGMYISIMFYEGWSVEDKCGSKCGGNPWDSHPFNGANNINGLDGDVNGDGEGTEIHTLSHQTGVNPAITALQDDYVEKMIDTLNPLDNIIWEITNESHSGSVSWQYHIIDHIRSYEAAYKPKRHLVWMSAQGGYTDADTDASNAEVVNYNENKPLWRSDPPVATGSKIVIVDSDHIGQVAGDLSWIWKCFTRGHNVIFMDPYYWHPFLLAGVYPDQPSYEDSRDAMGYTLDYADRMALENTIPQNGGTNPSSTGYCLYHASREYLVFQPTNGANFTVNLPAGEYNYEWFNPVTGLVTASGITMAIGGNKSFTNPYSADAVLYLLINDQPVAVIDANPTHGLAPLTVNFDGSGSYDGGSGFIVSYEWDFDNDGNIDSTDMITSHQYVAGDTYITSLKVTDNDTNTDIATVIITVVATDCDFDDDTDVDQEDFGHIQQCITGVGNPQNDPTCVDARLDLDEDVDLGDVTIFIACMSGANVPAAPNCREN
jgi:PKD repeat protein